MTEDQVRNTYTFRCVVCGKLQSYTPAAATDVPLCHSQRMVRMGK